MSRKSFDECYSTLVHDIEYLDEIVTYVKSNGNMLGKYENSMFCPECRNAELSYVHQTSIKRAFLRRKPSSVHLPGCSYNYEYSSPRFSKEYYESLSNEQIQDKMESMMRRLRHENPVNRVLGINEADVEGWTNPFILVKQKNGQQIRRSLRRKKLSKWLDKEIEGILHLFYGEAKLKVRRIQKSNEEGEPYSYYFLDIFCKNRDEVWKKKTQIYRGSIKDIIVEDRIYYFVAVGKLDFSGGFPKLELSNKQSILFR